MEAGAGDVLAREAARDEIHDSTPRATIEGADVVPDRRLIQGLVFHPRHDRGRSVGFPFDIHDGTVGVSEGEGEAEFDSPTTGE